jgi:hypothetical protein
MKTPISEFCEKRMMNQKIEEAFAMYCRASFANSYAINKDGDTINSLILRMTDQDVENMWEGFVLDFRNTLV